MKLVDAKYFIFNGVDSRDYRLMMGMLDGNGEDRLNLGLDYEVETFATKERTFDCGASYSDILRFEKELFHSDGSEFTHDQIREILSWLDDCKDDLRWLTYYDEDTSRNINYLCRITSKEKIKLGGKIVGLKVSVTCDSQYAYSDLISQDFNDVTHVQEFDGGRVAHIYMDSDDYVFPNYNIEFELPSGCEAFNFYIENQSIIVPPEYTDVDTTVYQKFLLDYSTSGDNATTINTSEKVQLDSYNEVISGTSGTEKRTDFNNIFNFTFPTLRPGDNIIQFYSSAYVAHCIITYRNRYKVGEF